MPVHDWTRVSAGTFHDFHTTWIADLKRALNGGLLPDGFYAMAEQSAGEVGPDVLTLQAKENGPDASASRPGGMTAVAEAPPKVSITQSIDDIDFYALKRRTLIIRHSSGDRIVALIEILSPGNKSSAHALERFLDKAVSTLINGYHLLLIDLHPTGSYDPEGIHGALWAEFNSRPYHAPSGKPLTLAAYTGGLMPKAYVEPIMVGVPLPDMPLFLEEDRYINVPLEKTYGEAYAAVPERWRRVIEGRESPAR